MYQYRYALGKALPDSMQWTSFDLDAYPLNQVLLHYRQVYVGVFNPYTQKEEYFVLDQLATQLTPISMTFSEWLTQIGNQSLPTQTGKVKPKRSTVKRKDLVKAGWKMTPVTKLGAKDAPETNQDRDWLFLEKPGVEPLDCFRNAMVSVNGYYHRLDGSAQGVWVADGMKTIKHAKANHLSLLSFKEVGSIQYLDFTEDMIYNPAPEGKLYDRCFVQLPEGSLNNKTIILSLGGYLHIQDWLTFRHVGESLIEIDFKNLPLLKRIHESMDKIDLSSLPLTDGYTLDHLSLEDMTSDAFIKAYLKLPQSFIVVLDAPEVFVERHNVMALPSPGAYISFIEPKWPMVYGHGKAGEFWDVYDHGEWALRLPESAYYRRNYTTTSQSVLGHPAALDGGQLSVNAAALAGQRTEFSKAWLLEIGKETMSVTK